MGNFSQKHYEFLARFLRREIELAQASTDARGKKNGSKREETLHSIARLIASELQHDNPKFNHARFLSAAGSHE